MLSHEVLQGGGSDVISVITKLMKGIKRQQQFSHCLQHVTLPASIRIKDPRQILITTEASLECLCFEIYWID